MMNDDIVWLSSFCLALALGTSALAQGTGRPADRAVRMDEQGVLRWQDTGEEVALFGVNYYTPCSINYADLKRLGVKHETVIDQDVAHFARMGLDAIRLHVWDREISDRDGNLVENEHLRLLDHLIARCKERGIYTMLTPIAWWGTQNPSQGFSNHFTMHQMTTDLAARKPQQTYLAQFVRHVNPHTKLAYKDDPAVVAFELINEPLYPPKTTDAQITDYINALTDAIRSTGCRKPIFYNGWQNRLAAVRDSKADGSTFGWYPTGLVAGRSLRSNFLPRVEDYPTMRSPDLGRKGKIVYEFDAADVPGSYLYPAMARAFRSGGAQIATQFQYDPLPLAPFNVGWQTHYLNLVYAPNKAVSFTIAAEAFRRLPRLQTYGKHPQSDRFGPFRVSFEDDLSEMVTEEVFMHSNDTTTSPPALAKLKRIAACGSSPVVRYEGTGAYFLDKLASGVWRLEVYPDAVWVNEPYGAVSLEREVSRVLWREWPMEVRLPDLGADFTVEPINEGNAFKPQSAGGKLSIRPGVYLLRRSEAQAVSVDARLREFIAPPDKNLPPVVWHDPRPEWVEGKPLPVLAAVVTAQEPEKVTLHFRAAQEKAFRSLPMTRRKAYQYEAQAPGEWLPAGQATYCLAVQADGRARTFPFDFGGDPIAAVSGLPQPRTILAVPQRLPLPEMRYSGPGKAAVEIAPGSEATRFALRLTASAFGEPPSCAGLRLPAEKGDAALFREKSCVPFLVLRARSLHPQTSAVEVGLVEREGSAYGCDVALSTEWREVRVPLSSLRPLWATKGKSLRVENLAEVSLVFGAWLLNAADRPKPHGLEVERLALEASVPLWEVPVLRQDAPVALFDAQRHRVKLHGEVSYRQSFAPGMTPGRQAVRIAVEKFGPPPSAVSFRHEAGDELDLRREQVARCDTLRLRVRALESTTSSVEVVLLERDGTPWGTTAPLTMAWQEVRVPLSSLRYFSHWRSGPSDRGKAGDRLKPENVTAVSVCFGAWLYPDHVAEPHSIEIETIALQMPSPQP